MSEYSERVRSSGVVSNLRLAEAKLRELEQQEWEHQDQIDLIARIKIATTHVLGRLTVPDYNLITVSALNELGRVDTKRVELGKDGPGNGESEVVR